MPPFYCKNRAQLYDKIKNDEPYFNNNWSKKVRNLLGLLFAKDPDVRMSNIVDIKNHPWFATIDWSRLTKK